MLTERQKLIFDFEGKHFKYQGAKEAAIRELFGNVTRCYQQLGHLIGLEFALAYAPMTVRRLQGRRRRVHVVNSMAAYRAS